MKEISTWIYYTILVELLLVSYLDIKTQKIKNIWSLFNIGFYFILLIFFNEQYPLRIESYFYSFGFLIIGFIFYLLKIMGAGDTKFLFSLFLVIPLSLHQDIMYRLITFTGISACMFLIFNTIKNAKRIYQAITTHHYALLKTCFGTKFAFAPVILIAWLWMGIDEGKF